MSIEAVSDCDSAYTEESMNATSSESDVRELAEQSNEAAASVLHTHSDVSVRPVRCAKWRNGAAAAAHHAKPHFKPLMSKPDRFSGGINGGGSSDGTCDIRFDLRAEWGGSSNDNSSNNSNNNNNSSREVDNTNDSSGTNTDTKSDSKEKN